MKKVLILGAGLVAGPLVRYFLERSDYHVVVADTDESRATTMVGSHPRGEAVKLSIEDRAALRSEIERADIVFSMVPNTFHPTIAGLCIDIGRDMLTASYVSPEMKALDAQARAKGILILNELGLDPGIDHMEAMRIIHSVRETKGQVLGFTSYCGGLPAPDSNTNPFGYKFSWSPRGVLLASKSSSRFLKDGEIVSIPGEHLFDNFLTIPIPGLGEFEGYPNRDSVPYREIYGIPEARTVLRGTLRYPGWCRTLKKIGELGFLDEKERPLAGRTYQSLTAELAGAASPEDLRETVAQRLGLESGSDVMDRLEWLGLFSRESLPVQKGSALDVLADKMIQMLSYAEGERDMIILQHEFQVGYPDGRMDEITSTLIDYGIPGGESSMSRTVGLPAAIAGRLVLERKIEEKGVQIPVFPELYGPILDELNELGIRFSEKRGPA